MRRRSLHLTPGPSAKPAPPNNSPDCVKSRDGGDLSLRACADWHGSGARVLCRRAIPASSGNAIGEFGVFTQPLAAALEGHQDTCPRVPPGRTPGRCAAQCRQTAHLPSRQDTGTVWRAVPGGTGSGRCGGRCPGVLGLRPPLASSGCCAMLPEQRWDDVRDATRIPSGDATQSSRPLGAQMAVLSQQRRVN